MAYVAVRTGYTFSMFHDWATVSGFFLQDSMYSLQEWLNVASPHLPALLAPAASVGVLALCAITLAAARRLANSRLFSLAAVTSIFWTYHAPYDFVLLLPVLLPLAGWSYQRPVARWNIIGVGLFVAIGLALPPTVVGGHNLESRVIRWAARLAIIGLFVGEYVEVCWNVHRGGTIMHGSTESDSGTTTSAHSAM
jgi:hypothetical protein